MITEEEDSSEEIEFVQKLIDFHEANDSQIPKGFWTGVKRANLLTMYQRIKHMGGYDTVVEHKMWKYLFGLDCGFNTISRKKYERVLLPFERYEMSMAFAAANNGAMNSDNGFDGAGSRDGGLTRRLTEAEIGEIQRQMRLREAEGQSGAMPVAVIVGNLKSQMQMKQPHTTITVHQTTIHPQTKVSHSASNHPIRTTNHECNFNSKLCNRQFHRMAIDERLRWSSTRVVTVAAM